MSHRTRSLLALALASTLGLGMTLTARAQDFDGAGITISGTGSSSFTGTTTISSGTLSVGGFTGGSLISGASFTLAGNNNFTSSGSTVIKSGSLTFNLGLPTIGALPPLSGGSISTGSAISSGIPYLSGGGVPPPEVVPFAPFVPTLQPNAAPEPSAILLAVVAALGFVGLRRRFRLAAR
jgi:autotransporter-associated beta strand protein